MAYSSETGNVNVELLEKTLKVNRKGAEVVFQNDELFIISPSIQNGSDWFDVRKKNLERFKESKKKGLLILRYKDNFLIADLVDFANQVMKNETLRSTETGGEHWKYNIVVLSDVYAVYNQGNKSVLYTMKFANVKEFARVVTKIIKSAKTEIIENKPIIKEYNEELKLELLNVSSLDPKNLITHIQTYIKSKGFNYSDANIKNLYLSLRSKPFVIISGISGTGKTKIVQLFAESIGATEQNGQFMLIPVRPDWSDGSELLGYTDIANNFKEGPLTKLLIHAKDHPERPHFLLLDEMNLARVEYYFSDILSVMESRALTADGYTSSKLGETATGDSLWFPGNLYIIGTVNMDETTHPFSKKVLDRANTLQFNDIDLLNFDFLKESSNEEIEPVQLDNASLEAGYIQISHIYPQHEQLIEEVSKQLEEINAILKSIHAQVGYRVRDEICFYLAHNEDAEMLLRKNEALDFCYMQKILPRIAGSGERVEKVLTNLAQLLTKDAFPLCAAKIKEMQGRLGYDEFTAFW